MKKLNWLPATKLIPSSLFKNYNSFTGSLEEFCQDFNLSLRLQKIARNQLKLKQDLNLNVKMVRLNKRY